MQISSGTETGQNLRGNKMKYGLNVKARLGLESRLSHLTSMKGFVSSNITYKRYSASTAW